MDLEKTQITVVVRTPDQTSNDFVIECSELWTVKSIKAHICKYYPSKPVEKHQKIIYSGKLLSDNTVLKDVFREQEDKRHTVHLVCLKTAESIISTCKASTSSTLPQSTTAQSSSNSSSGSNSNSGSDSQTNPDGLRQRPGANSSYSPYYPYNYGGYQMQYGGNVPSSTQYYQAYWMQQYYAQQMAQYAQYSNQQMTSAPNALNANVNPAPVVNLAAAQPVNIANNAQPAQNNVRMNAGVGPAIDDDEDDQMNRDWLDWSYMFFRATVLISIVYFYSSMHRFMIVIGFMAFFYLYRQRQQTIQRRAAAVAAEAAAGTEEAAAGTEEAAAGTEEAAAGTEEAAAGTEAAAASADEVDGQQSDQQEIEIVLEPVQEEDEVNNESQEVSSGDETPPLQPGVFATVWIFFRSFFTSLIPHELPVANLN